jgi:hypothetical protein
MEAAEKEFEGKTSTWKSFAKKVRAGLPSLGQAGLLRRCGPDSYYVQAKGTKGVGGSLRDGRSIFATPEGSDGKVCRFARPGHVAYARLH